MGVPQRRWNVRSSGLQRVPPMKPTTERYQRSLRSVAERLADVARSLHSEGLEEQAQSVETTVTDLTWQCEVLDSQELASARSD